MLIIYMDNKQEKERKSKAKAKKVVRSIQGNK